MKKKKDTNKNMPLDNNEIKAMKNQFLNIIKEMPDNEFVAFMFAINDFIEFISFDEEDDDDLPF